jgi:DNA-binding NarL/FixJ family response regulator
MPPISIDTLILLTPVLIVVCGFALLRQSTQHNRSSQRHARNQQFHKRIQDHEPDDLARLNELTDREREIAELASRGWRKRKIAESLHLSENTVSSHLRNIFRTLDVHSKAELAARYRHYLAGNTAHTPDGRVSVD